MSFLICRPAKFISATNTFPPSRPTLLYVRATLTLPLTPRSQLPMLAPVNQCASHNCTVDDATVTEIAAADPLPAAAQAIVDASGPRPGRWGW